VAAAVILGAAVLTLAAARRPLLRSAGWMLVADDPIRPADVIIVAVDAGEAGLLEVADLVQDGISQRVALFAELPDAVDREFARRGVAHDDLFTRETRLLRALGIERIEQIPQEVAGTEDEGVVLPAWCDAQRLRSIVVVAGPDHTRRLRRVLRRAMTGHGTAVTVRRARHSAFEPDRWWLTRDGTRTEVVELEKLVFDFLRHPIS
jgi:hypothetical protein